MKDMTALLDRLAKKEALLAKGYDTEDKLISNPKESVSFDTGRGRVMIKYRDLEAVAKNNNILERQIDHLKRRICRSNLTNVSLRRNYY